MKRKISSQAWLFLASIGFAWLLPGRKAKKSQGPVAKANP
jgi:hypothetical protein